MRNIVRILVPWFSFFIMFDIAGLSVKAAIISSFLLFIVLNWRPLRRGMILNWAAGLFFSFLIANIFFLHIKLERAFTAGAFYAVLSLIALVSLLLKKPFTLQYAKQTVPRDLWQSPVFLKINNILTLNWATIFGINSAINFCGNNQKYFWPKYTATICFTVLGLLITRYLPIQIRKRYTHRK